MTATIVLNISKGKLSGQLFPFKERTICIIGRSRECHIRLPDDADHRTISRYHCLLDINPPAIRIRDFGSRNGTYVNGKKIGQREKGQAAENVSRSGFPEFDLHHGDRITLGNTVFQVEIEEPEAIAADGQTERLTEINPVEAPRPDKIDLLAKQLEEKSTQADSGFETIGDYTIQKKLGQGGMGAVYLTEDRQTGQLVALKLMLPQVAVEDGARNMFLRETENTKALKHPNVVALLDSGSDGDMFFFTLEYCAGGSVQDLIKEQGGRIPLAQAISITLQVLDGLEYAHNAAVPFVFQADGTVGHGRGLVHRDMKPANIYLSGPTRNPVAKVGDFGLAKAFDSAGLSGQTATGSAAGTPIYIPRQQILNYKYAKPEVDVWASAACLYKMVTGDFPRDFPRGEDPWLVALKSAPVPIRERDRTIPPQLAEVIDMALTDKPEIPFKSAAGLKKAIQDAF
ncbi:MAG: protein kinase [Gammaproteobacteria bacterium]|nr:protein kinase [Gammaproteobacteria bacterium]